MGSRYFLLVAPWLYSLCLICPRQVSGEEVDNIAMAMVIRYRKEKRDFFKKQPTEEEKEAFWTAWRDKLFDAAKQVPRTQGAYFALSNAETISNTVRDYPVSIQIIETLIDHYPEKRGYWMVELGEVCESAWLRTRDPAYGRKSIDAFLGALQGDDIDKHVRMLVTNWLAGLVEADFSTPEELHLALGYVGQAIQEFENGYEPMERAARGGVSHQGLLQKGITIAILDHQYEQALDWLAKYRGLANSESDLSAGKVLLWVDSRPKLQFLDDSEKDDYIAFLDSWLTKNPQDPVVAKVQVIPAEIEFRRDRLEEARARLEKIVNNHQSEIHALPNPDYLRANIWSMLCTIYNRLEERELAKVAAQKSMEIKKSLGLPAQGEEFTLEMARKREALAGNIHQNAEKKKSSYRAIIITNVILIIVLVSIAVYRKYRRSRQE